MGWGVRKFSWCSVSHPGCGKWALMAESVAIQALGQKSKSLWPGNPLPHASHMHTHTYTHIHTHTYTHMHTRIHKRIHVYTHIHLHTCTYTVTCMRGHMHTPHTYLRNTLVHTCAHTHSIHTYTCTHNTPTTLQYKYLAEEYKGPQLWSEGLTFSLNCNNWTVLFGLNLLNSFLPASKERGWITPSIRSLFIVKFCDFDGTRHIIHQKLVPVLLLYCWQAGVTAFGAWPGHPHQASAPRVTGIRVRAQGSLYCRYLWSFFPVPPPHSHTLLWFFWAKNCLVNTSHGQPSEAGRFSQD